MMHADDDAIVAFRNTKESLAAASFLSYFAPDVNTCLMTDTSDTAVGAVLQQHIKGSWHPSEFFTATTTEWLPDPSNYVRQLKALMQHIQSLPPRQPTNNYGNIPKGLATTSHVFIRQDIVRKLL